MSSESLHSRKTVYCYVRLKNEGIGKWFTQKQEVGDSLVVQWLGLCAPNTVVLGLIPDQGTRSHVLQLRLYTAK